MSAINTNKNVLLSIDNDLNVLYHSGVPGMSWYKHKQGKWQSHAQYAMGQANPDAKEKKGVKGAADKIKNAASDAITRYKAKNDAAIAAMDKYGGNTKGARRLAAGTIASGAAGGAVGAVAGHFLGKGMTKASGVDNRIQSHWNEYSRLASNRNKSNVWALNNAAHPETRLRGPSGMEQYHLRKVNDLSKVSDIAKAGVSATTTIGGALMGATLYKGATLNGYIKRASGTLRNTKMSPRSQEVYRQTFDKYMKEYSKKTKVNWGKIY